MNPLKTIIILLCLSHVAFSQKEEGLVKWLTIKEAQELNKKQPKPLLLIYIQIGVVGANT
jgi:hypothetical protein